MNSKWKVIASVAVVIAVFLAGFVPQFLDRRRLEVELGDTRARLATAQLQIRIDDIRSLAGRMLLEASQQNYGTASTYSTQYFDKVHELSSETENASLKVALAVLLDARDSIIGGLAQGKPTIMPELQSLLQRTYDVPAAQRI